MLKTKPEDRKHVVIYHANCQDGFAAAWCFWMKAQEEGSVQYEFIQGVYGKPLPDGLKDAYVYLVDFSYKVPQMRELLEVAHYVVVLDHHKSAIEDMITGPDPLIHHPKMDASLCTIQLSGAMIAWYYCFGTKKAPDVLLHIQDRDLWKFQSPHTEEVCQYFFSLPYDFTVWKEQIEAYDESTNRRVQIQEIGGTLVKAHKKSVAEHTRTCGWVELNGVTYPAINASYQFASDIGNDLAHFNSAVAIYQILHDNTVKVSMRSKGDSTDVAKLAQGYGGGGHKNAAGFHMSLEVFADLLEVGKSNRDLEYRGEIDNG